jgi:multidrug efflux pump subunit AcrB
VIAAIVPMAFVRGLMGPYMRPIPVGASAAMIFSLLVAFIVTPWASARLLKKHKSASSGADGHEQEDWSTRLYRRLMNPLIHRGPLRWGFLIGVIVLLLLSMSLVYFKFVTVKMLPFDNKSEFQVIIDMPEGTPLEQTARVAREMGSYLATVPEVTDFQTYVGTASPYNFNGLVRHYYLRRGPNVADIQVNLVAKHERSAQSHAISKRVRPPLVEIAKHYDANIKVAEVPPGPPVLQTLVAEIYGPDYDRQVAVARQVREVLESTPGVVDVDWYVEDDQPKYRFEVDHQKAAVHGVSVEQIAQTLRLAVGGVSSGLIHIPQEKEDLNILLLLPRSDRSDVDTLKAVRVMGESGAVIPLGDLVRVEERTVDRSIYLKNLMPVVYVTADVGGEAESPVYAILDVGPKVEQLKLPEGYRL